MNHSKVGSIYRYLNYPWFKGSLIEIVAFGKIVGGDSKCFVSTLGENGVQLWNEDDPPGKSTNCEFISRALPIHNPNNQETLDPQKDLPILGRRYRHGANPPFIVHAIGNCLLFGCADKFVFCSIECTGDIFWYPLNNWTEHIKPNF